MMRKSISQSKALVWFSHIYTNTESITRRTAARKHKALTAICSSFQKHNTNHHSPNPSTAAHRTRNKEEDVAAGINTTLCTLRNMMMPICTTT
jgi:hypothetical protein